MTTSPDSLPAGATPRSAWSFQPTYRVPPELSGGVPPVLDLTAVPAAWAEAMMDEIDAVAVATMGSLGGAVALWRSWRVEADGPPERVFVIESRAAGESPAELTGRFQQALAAAGLARPQVAVYREDALLPDYQRAARAASSLLWMPGRPRGPVAVARVYDGSDPATGPYFDADHRRVDGDELERIAAYLHSGQVILATTQLHADILDPGAGEVVPLSYRTDGSWVWNEASGYYLRRHGLAPDAEMLAQLRTRNLAPAELGAVDTHRALAALFLPSLAASRSGSAGR